MHALFADTSVAGSDASAPGPAAAAAVFTAGERTILAPPYKANLLQLFFAASTLVAKYNTVRRYVGQRQLSYRWIQDAVTRFAFEQRTSRRRRSGQRLLEPTERIIRMRNLLRFADFKKVGHKREMSRSICLA